MKTNKLLAVALSAGLVLGGASVAHAGQSGSSTEQPAEKTLYDLDQDVQKAKEEKAAADAAVANKKEVIERVKAKEDTPQNQRRLANEQKELEELEAKAKAAEDKVKAAEEAFNKKDAERKAEEKKAEDEKKAEEERVAGRAKALEEAKAELKAAGLENEKKLKELEEGETAYDVDQIKEKLLKEFKEKHLTIDEYNEKNKTVTIDEWLEQQEKEKDPEEKPEDKKTQTLDEWQIEQNEKDGYFTEEDAKRAGELALEKAGLKGLYKVEVAQNQKEHKGMWFWRFVPVEASEEKPGTPLIPLTPAEEVEPGTPGTPWTPLTPGESDGPILGGDDKVVLPEEKPEDNKETEIEEEKPNEGKEKEEKAKEKEKAKPAKQKGNNPKTGLVGLAPIYSTLAISMAGIVAARKKND